MSFFLYAIAAFVVYLVYDTIQKNRRPRAMFRWPILGDAVWCIRNRDHFNERCLEVQKRAKLGLRPFHFMIESQRFWGVSDPKDVEHMLKTNWKNYSISVGVRGEALAELLGNGIFHADGECWYNQRKTVSREFTLNNFKTFMLREFVGYAQQLKHSLVDAAKSSENVEMQAEFFRLTLDSFGKIAFGVDLGALRGTPMPFAAAFDSAQRICIGRTLKVPFIWKLQRAINHGPEAKLKSNLKVINDFVDELVSSRKSDPTLGEKNDLFSRLMSISEGERDAAKRVAYLRDMTVNFMIAGRDSTACALAWLLWEVSQHPNVEKKMVEELQDIVTTDHPTFEDLAQCEYLMAVIHEALRLHPSVPSDIKTVLEDDVLPSTGAKLRKGDTCAFRPFAQGRTEELWGPDVLEFKPERWLNEKGQFQRADPFKFSVFQAGPRLCLGVEMAILEMKSVVSTLYKAMTFEAVNTPEMVTGLVAIMAPPGLLVKVRLRK